MEIYFLGTNAGVPTLQRNVTSIALRLLEERRTFWMFDCGEGTQHQVLRSPLRLGKLEKLFITHLHGDHLFGLPGLLSSRGYQGGTSPLTVYGPPGIKAYLDISLSASQSRIPYKLEIIEHGGGLVFEDDTFKVEAGLLEHRIDSYGYRVTEKDSPGTVIRAADVIHAPKRGRIVTILGDTRPCEGTLPLSQDADLIIHEATFAHDLADMAYQYHHSTARQAAELAREAGGRELLLTHFSSRYSSQEELIPLLEEAQAIFPATLLAEEFCTFPVHRRAAGNAPGE
jgi:ribonuclease Z